jgi:hypothetical protein
MMPSVCDAPAASAVVAAAAVVAVAAVAHQGTAREHRDTRTVLQKAM